MDPKRCHDIDLNVAVEEYVKAVQSPTERGGDQCAFLRGSYFREGDCRGGHGWGIVAVFLTTSRVAARRCIILLLKSLRLEVTHYVHPSHCPFSYRSLGRRQRRGSCAGDGGGHSHSSLQPGTN